MKIQLLLISLFFNMVVIPASPTHRMNVASLNQPFFQAPEATATPTLPPPPEKKNSAPTRTPRPTSTPVPIPPAADPNATSLMILFGLIAVMVVIVGVWLNRSDK